MRVLVIGIIVPKLLNQHSADIAYYTTITIHVRDVYLLLRFVVNLCDFENRS